MLPAWTYLLCFGIALSLTFSTTPLVRAIAIQSKLVDHPNDRKVHQHPVARLGGISICLGTLLALNLSWQTGSSPFAPTQLDQMA